MDDAGNNIVDKVYSYPYFICYNNFMKWKEKYINFILQIRKLRHKKWNDFFQGIMVSKWRNTGPRF